MKRKITHLLETRTEEIIERVSLEKKLRSGKKLTVKLGADPSVPDLHLGHALALHKLKEFQDLGHRVVFIIGDFTASVGDPSGRNTARPPLGKKEITKNAETYLAQAGKILNLGKTDVRYNREWFSSMNLDIFFGLAAQFSLRRIMDRKDFQERIKKGGEIGMHEALYQVLQAYDSHKISADVEVGGRDQLLNLLAGRELQKKLGEPPQDIIIMPLLLGTDGRQKMSKSFGNYIGLQAPAEEMFGKVMSIPDNLILHYAALAAFFEGDALKEVDNKIKIRGPFEAKMSVAEKIVELYWGQKEGERARNTFIARFSKKGALDEVYERKTLPKGERALLDVVLELAGARSKSEARRLILGMAVEFNHKVITDPNFMVSVQSESTIRIGKKKFFKIIPK